LFNLISDGLLGIDRMILDDFACTDPSLRLIRDKWAAKLEPDILAARVVNTELC
jgi:hypothetical protein